MPFKPSFAKPNIVPIDLVITQESYFSPSSFEMSVSVEGNSIRAFLSSIEYTAPGCLASQCSHRPRPLRPRWYQAGRVHNDGGRVNMKDQVTASKPEEDQIFLVKTWTPITSSMS